MANLGDVELNTPVIVVYREAGVLVNDWQLERDSMQAASIIDTQHVLKPLLMVVSICEHDLLVI